MIFIDYWINENGFDARESKYRQVLRLKAEEAKIQLSANESYATVYEGKDLTINRDTFEEIIKPIVDKTIVCCNNALKDAGIKKENIDEIVLVGGSTRVPLVKQMLRDFFGKELNDSVDPDEVVALGAAIQADILAGNTTDLLLLDVTPLSLGLETMGGLMDVLLPRNSKIPTKVSRQYTTYKDGQSGMKIAVYQGERDMVKDNRRLAEFNLTGIPGMPAGMPKVEVIFNVDANGVLSVTAKDKSTGKEQKIRIEANSGLTPDEIERMKQEAESHAGEDLKKKELIEARNIADQLIYTAEKSLTDHKDAITPEIKTSVEDKVKALREVKDKEDIEVIKTKTSELSTEIQKIGEHMSKNQSQEQTKQPEEEGVREAEVEKEEKSDDNKEA